MISPHRIKYRGVESTELNILDLIMCVAFDSDNGETNTFLNREAVVSETYDGRYKRVHRYKYNESFSPKFTFMKKDFGNFTIEEVRQVIKWLTSIDTTALLNVYYDDSNVVSWAAIGGWTEISTYKLANNRTVGIVATFEAVTPYAMSDIEPVNKIISENNKEFNIDTDDNQPIYPKITIQQKGTVVTINKELTADDDMIENTVYFNGSTYYWKSNTSALCVGYSSPGYDGWALVSVNTAYASTDKFEDKKIYYYTSDQKYRWVDPYVFKSSIVNPNLTTTGVRIRNTHQSDFGSMGALDALVVKNNNSTEKIIIDGANKIISSTNTRRIFGDDFNWKWLELFDGTNEITVEGNCEVQIEYRTVKKIGEY